MIGINTFGLSELLRTNFSGTLQKLYSCGFGVLEPCILFDEYSFAPVRAATHANLRHYRLDGGIWFSGNNAIKRLETARSLGFTVLSVQSSLALAPFLKYGFGEAVHFLKEQNIRYLVVSPMKKSTALAKKLIPYLQSAAEMLEKQGLSLVLHNHEHECLPEANGEALSRSLSEKRTFAQIGARRRLGALCGQRCPFRHAKIPRSARPPAPQRRK